MSDNTSTPYNHLQHFQSDYCYLIYTRTYARWLENESRREVWPETVNRYMDYMKKNMKNLFTESEYGEMEDAILNLKVMPSMRLLQFAGKACERDNICAYNCSFVGIESLKDFADVAYILMCGTGVGFSCENKYISNLPFIKEHSNEILNFTVPDSRKGWANSLLFGLETWYDGKDVIFDYSLVRPKGARLYTTGGRASGYEPLKELHDFVRDIILNKASSQLSSIQVHDIVCMTARIIVAGGVRRSAIISLSDLEDENIRNAKMGEFWNTHPHRCMANNSAVYTEKPSFDIFKREWDALIASGSGERGIFNKSNLSEQLPPRRIEMIGNELENMGTNPCGEIYLLSKEFCNLSTVVCRPGDTKESLKNKIRIATMLGTYQSTLTHFKFISPKFKENVEKERLLGVSMTGQHDSSFLQENPSILSELKEISIKVNREYADRFGINRSTAITCVKPEGTTSEMVGSSSGIHARYSPYYVRRVRIAATDPLSKMLIDQNIDYSPEVGETIENIKTYVFSFPQKSPENSRCINDMTVIDQLEYWKLIKTQFTEHNPSTTINVKHEEWSITRDWILDNWKNVGGLAFLPTLDSVYMLAPFEKITKEEYFRLTRNRPLIDFSNLSKYEKEDSTDIKKMYACVGDSCTI